MRKPKTAEEVFSQFSQWLDTSTELEEKVPVEQWLEDPYYSGYLASSLWPGVKEDITRIVNHKPHPKIIVIKGGTGTGKTATFEGLCCYRAYDRLRYASPPRSFGLPETSTIVIGFFSSKLSKAKDVGYQRLRRNIMSSPWFREKHPPNDRINNKLVFGATGSFVITPLPSTVDAAISEDFWQAYFDEVNFWGGKDVDSVDDVVAEAIRRMKSRIGIEDCYQVVLASSATTWNSYTERMAAEADLVIDRTRWSIRKQSAKYWFFIDVGTKSVQPKIVSKPDENVPGHERVLLVPQRMRETILPRVKGHRIVSVPNIQEPDKLSYLEEAQGDIKGFLQDWVGIAVSDQLRLYGPWINRYPCRDSLNPEELRLGKDKTPEMKLLPDENPRVLHVDLGLGKTTEKRTGDWASIACGFPRGVEMQETADGVMEKIPLVALDFAIRMRAEMRGEELELDRVMEVIYQVAQERQVHIVTFDGFQSAYMIQLCSKNGVRAERQSVDRTGDAHNYLRQLFATSRMDVPYCPVLLNELFNLVINPGTGKVDHPKVDDEGKPGTKDLADTTAGVAWTCHNELGEIEIMEPEVELECLVFSVPNVPVSKTR